MPAASESSTAPSAGAVPANAQSMAQEPSTTIKIAVEAAAAPAGDTKDMSFNLRQAKAIHNFDNTSYSNDSSYNYLKLTAGDYLLITKKLDDNWLVGENSAGDKGLFPLNCIELIQGKNSSA